MALLGTVAAAPTIPAAFRKVVADKAGADRRAVESFEAGTGASQQLLVIFGSKDDDAGFETTLCFFESDGKAAKTLRCLEDEYVKYSLPEELAIARFNGKDLNGDGTKEVLFESYDGGNGFTSNLLHIYSAIPGKVVPIAVGPIYDAPVDLDKDDIAELLMSDWRWEFYRGFCHACSPGGEMVYQWNGKAYVYASPKFKEHGQRQIDLAKAEVAKAKQAMTTEDRDAPMLGDLETAVVSLVIAYGHAGRLAEGLGEAERVLEASGVGAERRKEQQDLLADLKSGEGAGNLKIKVGDPLPADWSD